MRKIQFAIIALLIGITGCTAGSRLTLGPAMVKSSVSAHEWQAAEFHCENGCIGSTYGFLSSEACAGWGECKAIAASAYITWDQKEKPTE